MKLFFYIFVAVVTCFIIWSIFKTTAREHYENPDTDNKRFDEL